MQTVAPTTDTPRPHSALPPAGLLPWLDSTSLSDAQHYVVVESPTKCRAIADKVNGFLQRAVEEGDASVLERVAATEIQSWELRPGEKPVDALVRQVQDSGRRRYAVTATRGHFKTLFPYTPQERGNPAFPEWALPWGFAYWDEEEQAAFMADYQGFLKANPQVRGDDPLCPETNPRRYLGIAADDGYQPWYIVDNQATLSILHDMALELCARAIEAKGLALAEPVGDLLAQLKPRELNGLADALSPDDPSVLYPLLQRAAKGNAATLGGNILYTLAAEADLLGDWSWDPREPVGTVYIATDPDREGELIGMHVFQEVEAFAAANGFTINFVRMRYHALGFWDLGRALLGVDEDGKDVSRQLQRSLVAAASTRETLDRLIGYPISRALRSLDMGITMQSEDREWRAPVSAGRVQVAAMEMLLQQDEKALLRVPALKRSFVAEGDAGTFRGSTVNATRVPRLEGPARVTRVERDTQTYWPEPCLTLADFQDTLHRYKGLVRESPWYEMAPAGRLDTEPFRQYVLQGKATTVHELQGAPGDYVTLHNGTGETIPLGRGFKAQHLKAGATQLFRCESGGKWAAASYPAAKGGSASAKAALDAAQSLFAQAACTYPRTDSKRLSGAGFSEMQALAKAAGIPVTGSGPTGGSASNGAQEAHEALRPKLPDGLNLEGLAERSPTDAERQSLAWLWAHYMSRVQAGQALPEFAVFVTALVPFKQSSRKGSLTTLHFRAFDVIARRTLASLMGPAETRRVVMEIEHAGLCEADGTPIPLEGVNEEYVTTGCHDVWRRRDATRHDLADDFAAQNPDTVRVSLTEATTTVEAPRRSRANSLVRQLDEAGIGRPSTTGPMIETLEKRGYVHKGHGGMSRFGALVTSLIRVSMGDVVGVPTTAEMEAALDAITTAPEAGVEKRKTEVLDRFFRGSNFLQHLDALRQVASRLSAQCKQQGCGGSFADGRLLRERLQGVWDITPEPNDLLCELLESEIGGTWHPWGSLCLTVENGQLVAAWQGAKGGAFHGRLWHLYNEPNGAASAMMVGVTADTTDELLDRLDALMAVGAELPPVLGWLDAWNTVFAAEAYGNEELGVDDFIDYTGTFATLARHETPPGSVEALLKQLG